MTKKALLAKLKAKPGKEKALEEFLESALQLVLGEPQTLTWYAVKFSPATFGIFDTFSSEEGLQAHLAGDIGKALTAYGPDLLEAEPEIVVLDVLATK